MGSRSLLWGSSQPRDWTQISCITGGFFTSWATREHLKELKMELFYDPAIPLLGIHPKKIKTLIWKKYMYPHLHSSIIYYSQDMETTKVFIHRWMNGYRCEIHTHTHTHTDKHTHNGILFSNRKGNLAIRKNMIGPWGHYAKWNKSEKDKYYMTALKCEI